MAGADPEPGRALARRYTWPAAAEAHRAFYRGLPDRLTIHSGQLSGA
jgi:hypothetical protein